MSEDKNIDPNRLSDNQRGNTAVFEGVERNSKIAAFAGAQMETPKPGLLLAGNETIFESPNLNAQIVITRDRPSSIFSGYGGKGHQKCATIDLVAGRLSSISSTTIIDEKNEEAPAQGDPNFYLDAARVYISEKTDIDLNFNLEDTEQVFESTGRSAVGIKADAVRIIGNEGVKIVTGVYDKNSRGGDATPAGIVLMAMNDNDKGTIFEVEPFAKGNKLKSCLFGLEEQVYKLNSLLTEFITAQISINQLFADHNHHTGISFTTEPCINSFDRFNEFYDAADGNIDTVFDRLDALAANLDKWNAVYLSPESKDFILSLYNGTN